MVTKMDKLCGCSSGTGEGRRTCILCHKIMCEEHYATGIALSGLVLDVCLLCKFVIRGMKWSWEEEYEQALRDRKERKKNEV